MPISATPSAAGERCGASRTTGPADAIRPCDVRLKQPSNAHRVAVGMRTRRSSARRQDDCSDLASAGARCSTYTLCAHAPIQLDELNLVSPSPDRPGRNRRAGRGRPRRPGRNDDSASRLWNGAGVRAGLWQGSQAVADPPPKRVPRLRWGRARVGLHGQGLLQGRWPNRGAPAHRYRTRRRQR